jgi:3-carboxy-cis,cis-muconate cycloisomerase
MAANLEITHGLILAEAVAIALGEKIGKMKAHELVEEASARAVRERRHLRDVLLADARVGAHLTSADLERLFDPRRYTGQAERLVTRALAARELEGDGSADA